MNINSITSNSFKALLEPHKNNYTTRQEKLAGEVRQILASKVPDDDNGRTYLDLYKDVFGLDVFIRPNNEKNSIDVLSHDKSDESFELINNYKKSFRPKESHFYTYTRYLMDDARDFLEKVITFSLTALFFGLMILTANKKALPQNLEQIKKVEIAKTPKNLEKASAELIDILK